MSQNPFETKKFKELFAEWNEKLINSGHKEIEDFSLPNPPLKTWDDYKFKKIEIAVFEVKQRYFQLAGALLENYEFESEEHKMIWKLHSDGTPIRKIASQLGKKKFKKTTVHQVILHIKKEIE